MWIVLGMDLQKGKKSCSRYLITWDLGSDNICHFPDHGMKENNYKNEPKSDKSNIQESCYLEL